MKSQLVFRPEWLRETRLGEILHTASKEREPIAVAVPPPRPVHRVVDRAGAGEVEMENEPPPAQLPPRTRWFGR